MPKASETPISLSWEYESLGKWIPYDRAVQTKLTNAYKTKQKINIDGKRDITVTFNDMMEHHESDSDPAERRIRCLVEESKGNRFIWQYLYTKGEWKPYNAKAAVSLETAYNSEKPQPVTVNHDNDSYVVNLATMSESSSEPGSSHPVERRAVALQSGTESADESEQKKPAKRNQKEKTPIPDSNENAEKKSSVKNQKDKSPNPDSDEEMVKKPAKRIQKEKTPVPDSEEETVKKPSKRNQKEKTPVPETVTEPNVDEKESTAAEPVGKRTRKDAPTKQTQLQDPAPAKAAKTKKNAKNTPDNEAEMEEKTQNENVEPSSRPKRNVKTQSNAPVAVSTASKPSTTTKRRQPAARNEPAGSNDDDEEKPAPAKGSGRAKKPSNKDEEMPAKEPAATGRKGRKAQKVESDSNDDENVPLVTKAVNTRKKALPTESGQGDGGIEKQTEKRGKKKAADESAEPKKADAESKPKRVRKAK